MNTQQLLDENKHLRKKVTTLDTFLQRVMRNSTIPKKLWDEYLDLLTQEKLT